MKRISLLILLLLAVLVSGCTQQDIQSQLGIGGGTPCGIAQPYVSWEAPKVADHAECICSGNLTAERAQKFREDHTVPTDVNLQLAVLYFDPQGGTAYFVSTDNGKVYKEQQLSSSVEEELKSWCQQQIK